MFALQGITMHDFQFYDRDALEALQAREHEFADRKNAIIAEIKVKTPVWPLVYRC